MQPPEGFKGAINLLGLRYPSYRFLVIVVGLTVAVAVPKMIESTSGCDKDRVVAGGPQAHRHARSFEERADAVWLAGVVSIFEEANSVRRGAGISRGAEVSMALDHQHAAAAIDRNSSGSDDLGLGRDPLENQPRVKRPGRCSLGAVLECNG